MLINEFELCSEEKLKRVVEGTPSRDGSLQGGLGFFNDEGEAVDKDGKPLKSETILALYDKLAGYIKKDGIKVKTGAFWDFKLKKPREKPDIMYIFPISAGEKWKSAIPLNLEKRYKL